jgi:Peptidase family M1 domain
LLFAVLCGQPLWSAQGAPPVHERGPGETLYLQLSDTELDPGRVFQVRGASLDRSAIHITLEDGTIAFTKDVLGRITGAFFEGDGELLLVPPNEVERRSMSLFTGMAILEERFATAYLRFNDNTAAELQPGLRSTDEAEQFVARWNDTARNLAHADAMRLFGSFSDMLPSGTGRENTLPGHRGLNASDRLLHARLQGTKLGVFDIFFDSTSSEQVAAGQPKTTENGDVYYNVWTSFSTDDGANPARTKEISQTLPAETESVDESTVERSYVIDARVRPPTELDAQVQLQLNLKQGGSRLLVFELSRFLQLRSVEADGKPVEFIQNPAIEGTRLARTGNDFVGVLLPEPVRKGQKISLRFDYGGEVLAEAGQGLLYVGARGNWYPNLGLALAHFDLTFYYPEGWTLVATGKPEPPSAESVNSVRAPAAEGDLVARFVSQRPLPVAGFNLGKYVRDTAKAGNVTVEAYATSGVEKNFPSPPPIEVEPERRPPLVEPIFVSPQSPSPARNAAAVADIAARAIDYYAARFGPFPYSQLALTQMPGRESQGWPGLVFLSSYAFLSQEERESFHMNATEEQMEQIVPAHETAHQWWGDLVAWASYRDQWFSEGLANYSALMILEDKNPEGFRLIMEKYRQELTTKNKEGNFPKDAGPVTLGSRLLSSEFPEGYEAISYGRATWLFHMLRSMMLDAVETGKRDSIRGTPQEPFVVALHEIRERYAGRAITTRELLDVFAENLPSSLRYEGKASLDWFMNGWVNGTSLPKLALRSVKITAKANTMVVTGVIRQTEAPEDLVTAVPLYAVVSGRAPVLLGRIFADGPESPFRIAAPLGTHKILLDPNNTILTSPK